MSAKDDVNAFLQLGAKYEIILVGLHSDVEALRRQSAEADEKARTAHQLSQSIDQRIKQLALDTERAAAAAQDSGVAGLRLLWAVSALALCLSVLSLVA
ncbi:MAG: hypothetical protein RLY50_551 [Actinomycetota bacterium]